MMNFFSFISAAKEYKTVAVSTFYLSIIEGVRLLMPFIALPYIIGIVGAENYGKVIFAQAVVSYFSVAVNFGLNVVAVKKISENQHSPDKLNHIVNSLLLLRFFLFCICTGILALLISYVPFLRQYSIILSFAFLTVIADVLAMTAFFQGIEKMQNITLLQGIAVIFYLITLFLCIKETSDYIYIPLLQSLGFIIAAIAGLVLLKVRFKIQFFYPGWKNIFALFKESFPFATSRFSAILNSNIAKTLAGITLGMQEVAILDIAQKIADAALIPANVLDQSIYPYNVKTKDKKFATRTFWLMLIFALLCGLLMFIFTPIAVSFLGHGKLDEAIPLTQILCLKVICSIIVVYIGSPVLVAFGYPKPFNNSVILSMFFGIFFYTILYFTNSLSLMMFIFMIIALEALVFIYRFYYCIKYRILFQPNQK